MELKYNNHCVGEDYPDLVVELGRGKVIAELKSTGGQLGGPEDQQLRNYMRLLNAKRGTVNQLSATGQKTNEDAN